MKTLLAFTVLSLASMMGVEALAQTQRSGSDTTRIVQQLQQVTAEKNKLQQDFDALKKQLDDLQTKNSQLSGEQTKLQQRARDLELAGSKLRNNTSSNDEALEKSHAQLQELIEKFRETAQTLKDVEVERDALQTDKAAQGRELNSCVDKNARMYLLSDEVLQKLEQQGVWSALKTKEPFTQLSRTRLENLADDYRIRIGELKLAGKNAASP